MNRNILSIECLFIDVVGLTNWRQIEYHTLARCDYLSAQHWCAIGQQQSNTIIQCLNKHD